MAADVWAQSTSRIAYFFLLVPVKSFLRWSGLKNRNIIWNKFPSFRFSYSRFISFKFAETAPFLCCRFQFSEQSRPTRMLNSRSWISLFYVFTPFCPCRLRRRVKFYIFTTPPGLILGFQSLPPPSSTSSSRCESRAVLMRSTDRWLCTAVLGLDAPGLFALWTPAFCWLVQTYDIDSSAQLSWWTAGSLVQTRCSVLLFADVPSQRPVFSADSRRTAGDAALSNGFDTNTGSASLLLPCCHWRCQVH